MSGTGCWEDQSLCVFGDIVGCTPEEVGQEANRACW